MSAARNQLAKVKRLLTIVEQQKAGDQAHDTLFGFFENCWHLKDHVKNDHSVPQRVRQSIESEVAAFDALMISADIANRSKHFAFNRRPRVDAKIETYHIKAYEGSGEEASATYDISIPGRPLRDALTVARQAVADWETLFARHGL